MTVDRTRNRAGRCPVIGNSVGGSLRMRLATRDPTVPAEVGLAWLKDASRFAHVDATERFVDAIRDSLTR
ncbi:MAG: hypothetical protein R3A52_27105 [Polyangiales bacterium]